MHSSAFELVSKTGENIDGGGGAKERGAERERVRLVIDKQLRARLSTK